MSCREDSCVKRIAYKLGCQTPVQVEDGRTIWDTCFEVSQFLIGRENAFHPVFAGKQPFDQRCTFGNKDVGPPILVGFAQIAVKIQSRVFEICDADGIHKRGQYAGNR